LYRYAADKSIKNVKEISKLRWCVIESKKENHHSGHWNNKNKNLFNYKK
jgi:hypothetical protein